MYEATPSPGVAGAADALAVVEVTKASGGVRALQGLSLAVRRGSITGLIGPNGAGKSTLFDVASGVVPADSGRVLLFGADVTGRKPHELSAKGLARTFQLARELGRLTVVENLMLAARHQRGERLSAVFLTPFAVREQERAIYRRALRVLDFARLGSVRDEHAANLSGGQKKLLELARALMTEAELILLDEPGAGVNPALMATLVEMIRALNAEHGKTFLIVEHDMDLVARLCDPVIVMADGRRLAEGSFAGLRRDPRVVEAYLGGTA